MLDGSGHTCIGEIPGVCVVDHSRPPWRGYRLAAMSPVTAVGSDELDLLDWKRHIFELYAEIRAAEDRRAAWLRWCAVRDELFRAHPQSPVGEADRESFPGARYAPYRPELATIGELVPSDARPVDVGTSTGTPIRFRAFADVRFQLTGEDCSLPAYWLEGYGGGLFLPFGDATNGDTTYGGGRYLLDTVKGSDLGEADGGIVLDFNFAYNPSCAYDPRWTCPLSPLDSRLEIPVDAGELLPPG
jgi:uncharacterized protein (DUF1684 family)